MISVALAHCNDPKKLCLRWLPTGDGGFWLVPSGEQQCPLGLMSLYWSQQPLLSKMNYRSPHSSESVICAQPAGQSSLLVAVVMDVNFHCRLLAPNSQGFTTQNKALKSFRLPPGTCRHVSDFFLYIIFLAPLFSWCLYVLGSTGRGGGGGGGGVFCFRQPSPNKIWMQREPGSTKRRKKSMDLPRAQF